MDKEDFRIKRTRTSIKRAFLELLNNKPLNDITVKEITELAQCNRNTFYLHYTDKYDLIDKLCIANLEDIGNSLYQTHENQYPSNTDWYFDIAKRCLDTIQSDIVFYEIIMGNNKYPDFADRFRELLVQFIQTGLMQMGKESKHKKLELEFSANGMVGVIRYWLNNQREYSKDEIARELHNFVISVGSVIFE